MPLPSHLLTCRYSKAKASAGGSDKPSALGLSQANFGPKYEAHMNELQAALEEQKKRVEELKRSEQELR